ncbi:MAG TPA: hypothetical protein PKE03_06195 [Bacteroidales bacterium]|nr:hypothetical protein [Bacteroidales bacterium]
MQTRYIIILILTFAAGIVIGVLGTGRITRSKVEKIKSWNTREGFRQHFFHIIEADAEQQEKIGPLLDSFGNLHWELMKKHWDNQKILFDEMDSLVKPYLNDAQWQRLMEFKENNRKRREMKQEQGRKDAWFVPPYPSPDRPALHGACPRA